MTFSFYLFCDQLQIYSIICQSWNTKTMDTFFQFKLLEFKKWLMGEPPMSHKPVWAWFVLYLILVLFPLMIFNIKDMTFK